MRNKGHVVPLPCLHLPTLICTPCPCLVLIHSPLLLPPLLCLHLPCHVHTSLPCLHLLVLICTSPCLSVPPGLTLCSFVPLHTHICQPSLSLASWFPDGGAAMPPLPRLCHSISVTHSAFKMGDTVTGAVTKFRHCT